MPDRLVSMLRSLPETGMGYQLVKLVLNNGGVIRHHKVLNAEHLLLEDGEDINASDIAGIELETG